MHFEIHDATLQDVDKIAELWLEFIQDPEGSDLNILHSEENRERWKKFVRGLITQNKGGLKFAVVNNEIAGYVFYSWSDSPLQLYKNRGTIYDLFVRKNHRGIGIGKALLTEAIKDLRFHHVEIIQLTVRSDNSLAIRLYESQGFRECLKIMRIEL